jgi:hypothetical protein
VSLGLAFGRPFVLALDVALELDVLNPPLIATAHLNPAEIAAAHQRIDLARRHIQHFCNVRQLQEPGTPTRHADQFCTTGARFGVRAGWACGRGIDVAAVNALETSMRIRGDAAVAAGGTARFDSRVWRDPRFLLGVLLVLASTVAGGLAVAAADHTVTYWATAGAVRLGEPVVRSDLVALRAKVPKRTAAVMLRTTEPLPSRMDRLSWASGARAGTFITRDMLTERRGTIELPVVVAAGQAPSDLRPGDRVDVWASLRDKDETATAAATAQRILARVRVLSRSSAASVNGGSGLTVVVDVAGLRVSGRVVGAVSSGRITMVRVS